MRKRKWLGFIETFQIKHQKWRAIFEKNETQKGESSAYDLHHLITVVSRSKYATVSTSKASDESC